MSTQPFTFSPWSDDHYSDWNWLDMYMYSSICRPQVHIKVEACMQKSFVMYNGSRYFIALPCLALFYSKYSTKNVTSEEKVRAADNLSPESSLALKKC